MAACENILVWRRGGDNTFSIKMSVSLKISVYLPVYSLLEILSKENSCEPFAALSLKGAIHYVRTQNFPKN